MRDGSVSNTGPRDRSESLPCSLSRWKWARVRAPGPDKAMFWRSERRRAEVQDGTDDIALALAADAWSRSGRVSVQAASASGPVRLKSGLVLVAQPVDDAAPRLPLSPGLKPVQQLDRTLCEIGERYGAAPRDRVMLEMEYPGAGSGCAG